MIGKTIGNYRIVEKLGKGATGTVFKALDETLGREVAVKVLHADVAQTDVMKRFQSEVKALARLNHPQIATIHDVQITDDGVLLVTELVRGESLDAMIKRSGALAPEKAALLVAEILSALAQAHAVGVVHRDLKPSSVMLTELGTIKLLDFAMAPVEGASQMTAATFAIGAPAFMAPERIVGNEVDARADVYSVGVVFYQLLTATLPYEAPSATEMVQKQMTEAPIPLRSRRADLPQWAEEIVSRALAKSPADRYQTADEFRAAVLSGMAGTGIEVTATFDAGPVTAAQRPATKAPLVDPDAATILTAIPATALGGEEPTAPLVSAPGVRPLPAVDPDAATYLTAIPTDAIHTAPPASSYTPTTGNEVTMMGARPAGNGFEAVTAAMPASRVDVQGNDLPTMLVPAPTTDRAPEPAPTAVASAPTGTTLVMERKQFAAAGVILGVLALAVVALAAVVMLRRPSAVDVAPAATTAPAPPPAAAASAAPAAATSPAVTPPAPVEAPAAPQPVAAAPPPPLEISEPPIRTSPAEPTTSARPSRSAATRVTAPEATPAAAPVETPANPNMARISNTTPLRFPAKAVVSDGDKRRERDATVLVAEGTVNVTFSDGKGAYSLPISALTDLTYSNSRQPLWQSPSGPAEAMRVEGGGVFGRGRANWLGFRTPDALMVIRVDDSVVGRVIAGLQDRTGLTVARLSEPKE